MDQRAGSIADARKAFTSAAAKAPAGWQAPLALARLAVAEGNLETAEAQLKIAAEKGPAEAEVLAAQGALAFAARRHRRGRGGVREGARHGPAQRPGAGRLGPAGDGPR